MDKTTTDFAKVNHRLEKSVYENFEKFKYGMIKPREFKETLRDAVNLPNLNVGYYDSSKESKSNTNTNTKLLQLTVDPEQQDDINERDDN